MNINRNKIFGKTLLLCIGAAVCASASAGDFNVWSYSAKGKTHDVVVSFAGNGTDEEVQLDLNVPAGLKFVSAKALVEGSVCVGLEKGTYVRAVAPSGAGTPLAKKETDYCRFSFMKEAGLKGEPVLTKRFVECSSPNGSIGECGLNAFDVSEKNAQQ